MGKSRVFFRGLGFLWLTLPVFVYAQDLLGNANNPPPWGATAFLGYGQELDYTDKFRFIDGTAFADIYGGMLINKPGFGLSFDLDFYKGVAYGVTGQNQTRFSLGVRWADAYSFANGQGLGYGVRLGYRNDQTGYGTLSNEALNLKDDFINNALYQRTSEDRNEIWFSPSLSYSPISNLHLHMDLTSRFIYHTHDFQVFGAQTGVYTEGWSFVNEDLAGVTYDVSDNDFLALDYLFVGEQLTRDSDAFDHFLILTYTHEFSNKDVLSPFVRVPVAEGKVFLREGNGAVTKEKDRFKPRVGLQYRHFFTDKLDIFFDGYYGAYFSREYDLHGAVPKDFKLNNIFYLAIELSYRF